LNAGYSFHSAGNDYEFYTAYGTAYAVSFIWAGEYFRDSHPIKKFIYRVDIEQMDPGPYNYFDFRTGITITEIIFHFFERDSRNVVFYICDPLDGRVKARIRKFKYWYRLFDNGSYNRIDAEIKTASLSVEASFIFQKNNVLAYDLPAIINEAKNNFSNK